jgi:hypothetical protein
MIKLTDLLEEVYVQTPDGEEGNDTLMKKGFKLGKATIDPETGASVTDVTYLPAFEQIRRQALSMRKEFQPFKFSANEDIAKVAKDINTNLTKVSQLIFALEKMIELQNKK